MPRPQRRVEAARHSTAADAAQPKNRTPRDEEMRRREGLRDGREEEKRAAKE